MQRAVEAGITTAGGGYGVRTLQTTSVAASFQIGFTSDFSHSFQQSTARDVLTGDTAAGSACCYVEAALLG